MAAQRILVLLLLINVAVSTEVVKLVGSSVKLDIQKHEKFDDIIWKCRNNILVKYYSGSKKVTQNNDRAEFSKTTYSLTLKNLEKNDSGKYEAKITSETECIVAEYTLSVLDPVETPVLTTVTDQQNRDTCNITLTCTGHDLSVTSNWFNETCEQKEMISPEGITLLLSARDSSSVICNISNPVSWNMNVMDMKDLNRVCHSKDHQVGKSIWIIVIIILISVIIIVFLIIKSKKTESKGTTKYAEVKKQDTVEKTQHPA